MSAMSTVNSIMSSPAKLAMVGGGLGLALSQFSAVTRDGETPAPTVGGAISQTAVSTVKCAAINAALGALMNRGNAMQGAKSGAIMGAVLGASLTGGSLVGQTGASILGY